MYRGMQLILLRRKILTVKDKGPIWALIHMLCDVFAGESQC